MVVHWLDAALRAILGYEQDLIFPPLLPSCIIQLNVDWDNIELYHRELAYFIPKQNWARCLSHNSIRCNFKYRV